MQNRLLLAFSVVVFVLAVFTMSHNVADNTQQPEQDQGAEGLLYGPDGPRPVQHDQRTDNQQAKTERQPTNVEQPHRGRFPPPTKEQLRLAAHKGSGGGARLPVMPPATE